MSLNSPPKNPHFNEQNILETLHPPDKDYGFMKIDEPKTPYEYTSAHEVEDEDDEGGQGQGQERASEELARRRSREEIDARLLAASLASAEEAMTKMTDDGDRRRPSEPSADEEDLRQLSPDERERRQKFEQKRKKHYNEFYAVKLAKQLMAEEDEEDPAGDGDHDHEERHEDSEGGSGDAKQEEKMEVDEKGASAL